jgi:hypothetical protein
MTAVTADQDGLRMRAPSEAATAVEATFAAVRRVCPSLKGACGYPTCRCGGKDDCDRPNEMTRQAQRCNWSVAARSDHLHGRHHPRASRPLSRALSYQPDLVKRATQTLQRRIASHRRTFPHWRTLRSRSGRVMRAQWVRLFRLPTAQLGACQSR